MIYQKAAEQGQAGPSAGPGEGAGSGAPDDDVVDAEFEEVDGDKK